MGKLVSGACAMVKVLLMLQKNMIPPHCGIKTEMNQTIPKDLKERQLQVAFAPTPFPRPLDSPRYVFINNFSAAGGNTAVLLEDAPISSALELDPRSSHVVVVSAKSLSSFKQNVNRLLAWTNDQPDTRLPSLAYTTTARHAHYQYRLAFEAKSMLQVREILGSHSNTARTPISSKKIPSIGFVFTGQGSHYIGMGKKLFWDFAQFRRDLEDYDRIACNHGFPSFIGLIDGSVNNLAELSPIVT